MLTLAEELLLLSLNNEKGTVLMSASTALPYGLVGAIIMELVLLERVRLENKNLIVSNSTLTGDMALDLVLETVSKSPKFRPIKHWIRKLGRNIKIIKNDLLNRLVEKGILRHQDHKILWIFPSKRYPTENELPELETRRKVQAALLNQVTFDERTAVLISLIGACSLIKEVFPKEVRKEVNKKIKEIMKGDLIGKAVSDVVAEIQAAVIAAVIASTATTTSQ